MATFCAIVTPLIVLWLFWKQPAVMYWVCGIFLWLQALAITFNFDAVYAYVVEGDTEKGKSIAPLAYFSCLCFLIPLAAAALTGWLTGASFLAIPCFILYSIVQTAILGAATEQLEGTKRGVFVLQTFIPILGFIITVIRLIDPIVKLFDR